MPFLFCMKIPKWIYALCALVIAFAVVNALLQVPALEATSYALAGRTIVIDPGHGGFDPGVLGCTGSKEKDINLQVSKLLAQFLREGGAHVVLLRESDKALAETKQEDLAERVKIAHESEGEIYLALHCNAFEKDSPWQGAQCFYHSKSEAALALAEEIQKSLQSSLQNTDRAALAHDTTYILKNLQIPAVIIEMGFLSNREEEANLMNPEYQHKMAWAIYVALCHYYSSAEQGTADDIINTETDNK